MHSFSWLSIVVCFVAFILVVTIAFGTGVYATVRAQQQQQSQAQTANRTLIIQQLKTSMPSVFDSHLKVEKVVDGLTSPTTMAFLD